MAEGAMRIEDIVERFNISLMTAHRDLDELASRGFLRKTRGIVSVAPTSLIESSDTLSRLASGRGETRNRRGGRSVRRIRTGDFLRQFDHGATSSRRISPCAFR